MGTGSLNRRQVLVLGASTLAGAVLPSRLLAAAASEKRPALDAALEASDLIYLTPLHSDGRESTCQAEVWFVADGHDAYVVTASDAWRARAVRSGLSRTRAWVGDVGVWSQADGAYRDLPTADLRGSLVTAPAEHARVLALFGAKYSLEWVMWGPRFRNGLADGSRVMLRYQPLPA